jgi:hypothetical protein
MCFVSGFEKYFVGLIVDHRYLVNFEILIENVDFFADLLTKSPFLFSPLIKGAFSYFSDVGFGSDFSLPQRNNINLTDYFFSLWIFAELFDYTKLSLSSIYDYYIW